MTDVTDKWGQAVAERGFAQVPNYLMQLNHFLDDDHQVKPVEMLVLLQLVGAWWKKEALPFPSMKTLATRCGVSDRQIQRAINQLEKAGLVERTKRRTDTGIRATNAYDLTPLVKKLHHVAKAFPNEYPRRVTRDHAGRVVATKKADAAALSHTDLVDDPSL